jgi:hypothetical protein
MHDPEICSMDRIVGIKDVRDPMLVVVISTSCYLDFISYAVTLASFCTISLDQRRRSSCVVSWVRSDVCLNIGSIGCVVCRGISRRVGWSVGRSIGSGLTNCATLFSPRPSSATGLRGPWLRCR